MQAIVSNDAIPFRCIDDIPNTHTISRTYLVKREKEKKLNQQKNALATKTVPKFAAR